MVWHEEDVLEIHPFDAEQRGRRRRRSRRAAEPFRGDRASRQSQRAHAAGRRLYDVPPRGDRRQCRDDRQFRLGDQLPGIQGDRRAGPAHEPSFGLAGPRSGGRRRACAASPGRGPMPRNDGAASIEVEVAHFSYKSGAVGPRSFARAIAVEAPIEIVIGGAPFAVMMATPRDLEDFAYGFLLTEGVVDGPDDIRGVEIEEAGEGWRIERDADRREAAGASRAQTGHRGAHRLRPLRRRGSVRICPRRGARSTAGRRSSLPRSGRRWRNSRSGSRSTR